MPRRDRRRQHLPLIARSVMVSVRLAPVASAALSLVATLLLAGCAKDSENKVAEAAAKYLDLTK
jgi:uncharacterized lipoprotein YajG